MQVVADDPITGTLFTDPKPNHNEDPPLVAWSFPQLAPTRLFSSYLQLNRANNLSELKLYNFILSVAIRVVVSEKVEGGILASLANEPSGAFWKKEYSYGLENGWKSLKNGG